MGHRVKYELIYIDEGDTRGWYAQSHCDCGSSLSSGEVHPEAFDAINICSENIANHIRENASGRCGNKNHQADTTAYAIGEAEAKVLFDAADAQAELDQVKSPTRQQLERFDELISQALTVLHRRVDGNDEDGKELLRFWEDMREKARKRLHVVSS